MNQRQGIDAREVLAEFFYHQELTHKWHQGFARDTLKALRQAAGDADVIALKFHEDGRVELLKAEEVEFPASSLSSFPFPTVQAVHRVYRLHPITQDQESGA